jgi:hypothetical protein
VISLKWDLEMFHHNLKAIYYSAKLRMLLVLETTVIVTYLWMKVLKPVMLMRPCSDPLKPTLRSSNSLLSKMPRDSSIKASLKALRSICQISNKSLIT